MCNGMAGAPGAPHIVDRTGRRRLPVGVSNFEQVVRDGVLVDKSLLISELLDLMPGSAALFCRPRRFGKSLVLSMLRCWLEAPVEEWVPDRSDLLDGLAVSEIAVSDPCGPVASSHAAHPVVHLSLKSASSRTWDGSRRAIAEQIAAECGRHWYLADSPRLTPPDRRRFASLAEGDPDNPTLPGSLVFLTRVLAHHHGAPCVVLLDEYDHPVSYGHANGYRREAVDFMREWLTGALKDNDALFLAVLTGVQRVSRESIFSGLNNLTVNTAMDAEFSEAFGFTGDEVAALCDYMGLADRTTDIERWYDGYCFGGRAAYNPWSVISCLRQKGVCQPYWANTSGNDVVRDLFIQAMSEEGQDAEDLRLLAEGGSAVHSLRLNTVFDDLGHDPDAIWGLLYLTGYVTTEDVDEPNNGRLPRHLRAPNLEVRSLWHDEFMIRAERTAGGPRALHAVHEALLGNDRVALADALEDVLLDAPPSFDLHDEGDYHLFLLDLMAGIPGYLLPRSNRERGRGRPDVTCRPEGGAASGLPSLMVECKRLRRANDDRDWADADQAALEALATDGLDQARDRAYAHGLDGAGVKAWGIAFCGKRVACALG